MLSVIYSKRCKIGLYAECHYAECCFAERRGATTNNASIIRMPSRIPLMVQLAIHGQELFKISVESLGL
jgi:hypothetical protein